MPDAAPPGWHQTRQTLRFCDTDAIGHINNAVYAVMFEAGRVELLREAGVLLSDGPYAPVIARLEIDFRREMHFPGTAVIETGVARIGTKSVHIRQRLLTEGTLNAEGLSVLAVIDRSSRRAVVLDDAWRAAFARWAIPAG